MEKYLIEKLQATAKKLIAENRNAKKLIAENQKAIVVITKALTQRNR